MGIIAELRNIIRSGGIITQLIALNLGVFLFVNLAGVILFLFGKPNPTVLWLALPAYVPAFFQKPWTIVSYMFLHENFLHILFNILWLYWFGIIFLRYFTTNQLLGLYLLGGLAGGIFYIATFNTFPVFDPYLVNSIALGASASVIAIVIATAVYVPNYVVYLFLIGPVRLKWIALVMIILDVLGIAGGNSGGHLAHLGGAIMGWIFILALKQKIDLTRFIAFFTQGFSVKRRKKSKLTVTYRPGDTELEYNKRKQERRIELDTLLDKIKKQGYDSLTKEEKEALFKYSSKRDL